jgi:hypothetical protein
MKVLIYTCFLTFILIADALGSESGAVTDRYIAMAIRGDLRQAGDLLRSEESGGWPGSPELADRFRLRFVDRTEPLSPDTGVALLDEAIAAYRSYWARSLLAESPQAENDRMLHQALGRLPGIENATGDPRNAPVALNEAIGGLGYGVLAIPAPPLQDLFVWRGRQDRDFTVELSDQTRVVHVAFLSDFVSRGWKDYATLGLAMTTGWVEDGVLYCVERAYAPHSERFEVSYLKHESRHLADLERFPDLRSADLEYRAKLTELAFASQTVQDLLADFTAKSAPNPQSPHAVANHRVIHDLHLELFGRPLPTDRYPWRSVTAGPVNSAARRLLSRDTEALEALRESALP